MILVSFTLREECCFWFYSKLILDLSSKCHPNPSVFSTCVIHTENLQKMEHVACFFFQNGSCDENRSLWRKWSFFSLVKVFEDMIVRFMKLKKNMRTSCSCNKSAASRSTHKATQPKVQILHPLEGHLHVCIMHSSISKHSYFLRSYLAFCWEKQSIILSWFYSEKRANKYFLSTSVMNTRIACFKSKDQLPISPVKQLSLNINEPIQIPDRNSSTIIL